MENSVDSRQKNDIVESFQNMRFSSAPATIKDVARHAGVSIGTVSRCLNGFTNVALPNQERVKKAVKELGYEKCRSAEMLVARRRGSRVRSGNVGLVFPWSGKEWASHLLISNYALGVERACQEKGFHALIEFSADDKLLPRCVRDNKVDGLLVKTTDCMPRFMEALPKNLPLVGIDLNDPSIEVPQVASDSRGAGWIVAEYLWKLGHRRIGFLCTHAQHPFFIARLQGWESYLRTRNGYDPALVALHSPDEAHPRPETTPPQMGFLLDHVLSAPEPPTALVTANDWMAFGLYAALAERGLSVPQNISVVGFDNDENQCNWCVPALTSFDACVGEVAYHAAHELFRNIEQPHDRPSGLAHLIRGRLAQRMSVQAIEIPHLPTTILFSPEKEGESVGRFRS